jgi:hypothetical protein
MNDPIVSPWIIYLLGVIGNAVPIISAICIASAIGFALYLIFKIAGECCDYDSDKEEAKKIAKIIGFMRWVFLLSTLILLFFPSKNTIIGILIASKVTPTTISDAVRTGKDFKDEIKRDVIDLINAIEKKEKKESK